MKVFLRYGQETKRLKCDEGEFGVSELMNVFREKFSLKPEEKPKGDALYLCDEEFRDVTFEMEEADDLYNGAVVEWRMPERRRTTAALSAGLGRRATASGSKAMRTPGVMAAIAAKKEADAKKATEEMAAASASGDAAAIAKAQAKIAQSEQEAAALNATADAEKAAQKERDDADRAQAVATAAAEKAKEAEEKAKKEQEDAAKAQAAAKAAMDALDDADSDDEMGMALLQAAATKAKDTAEDEAKQAAKATEDAEKAKVTEKAKAEEAAAEAAQATAAEEKLNAEREKVVDIVNDAAEKADKGGAAGADEVDADKFKQFLFSATMSDSDSDDD